MQVLCVLIRLICKDFYMWDLGNSTFSVLEMMVKLIAAAFPGE